MKLARTAPPSDRGTLYHKIADLFQTAGPELSSQERLLLLEIMGRLTWQVEMSLRMRLAERLADEPRANHDLILLLVNDAIEVATPLILRSKVLTDNDLISLITDCGEAHQLTVAAREHITEPVTATLYDTGSEAVWCALVSNKTAAIETRVLDALADESRRVVALQEPLVGRPDLPVELAERMCAWVSDALKEHLLKAFDLDPADIAARLKASVRAELADSGPRDNRHAQLAKLVDKLHATGQLKSTYLIKSLREGQRDMFELAFAKLLGVPLSEIEALLVEPDLARLALAIRAAGIDRSAFGSIAASLFGKSAVLEAPDTVKSAVKAALHIDSPLEARQHLFG